LSVVMALAYHIGPALPRAFQRGPLGARGGRRVLELVERPLPLRPAAASKSFEPLPKDQSFVRRAISSLMMASASWGTTSHTTRSTTSRESARTASACWGVRPSSPSLPARWPFTAASTRAAGGAAGGGAGG